MKDLSQSDPGVSTLVPVLMAGGSGSRLWPMSREAFPKQFLCLNGNRSLLQDTIERAVNISGAATPVVIGSEAHRFLLIEQLRQCGVDPAHLLLEPHRRDTAPAAAAAAHYVSATYGPEAILLLMPADHHIADLSAFLDAVETATALAAQGEIVTFGIRPTMPATGFGYLRCMADNSSTSSLAVEAFVEKPDQDRARNFVEDGRYYWNGGIFMFRVDRFFEVLTRLAPDLSNQAAAAVAEGVRRGQPLSLGSTEFSACQTISLDYAVMEHLGGDMRLVPLDAGWDDVGSWTFLGQLPACDEKGNRVRGDVLMEECDGNLVHAEERLVTMIGMSDHVVVETRDAVLVAPKSRAQDVKQVVARLKDNGRSETEHHPRIYRPWGTYETVANGERFQVKRIVVNPGQKLSLQMHYHRAEHWVVVRGTAKVVCADREFLLSENESTYIPLGNVHRLENPGLLPLELIEVQSGGYLGEDDIVRFDDIYGRQGQAASPVPKAKKPEAAVVATGVQRKAG